MYRLVPHFIRQSFGMIRRTDFDCSFIQYLSTGLFNGNMLCSLWGTKWTNTHTHTYNVYLVL